MAGFFVRKNLTMEYVYLLLRRDAEKTEQREQTEQ